LLLRETAKHPACFVAVEGAIGLSLWRKTHLPKMMLAFRGGGTRSQVSLPRKARYSSVIASSQLGSLSVARSEEGTGEYLSIEACKLSRSRGGTCMPEVLRVRCTSKGAAEGACAGEDGREGAGEGSAEGAGEGSAEGAGEGGAEGADEGGTEGVGEGGAVGVCGATGGTTIEGTSSRNS
jgi:hypothetical protein